MTAGETPFDLSPENDFRVGPFNAMGTNLGDIPEQPLQSDDKQLLPAPHVYTDEKNLWFDSLGSHPAD